MSYVLLSAKSPPDGFRLTLPANVTGHAEGAGWFYPQFLQCGLRDLLDITDLINLHYLNVDWNVDLTEIRFGDTHKSTLNGLSAARSGLRKLDVAHFTALTELLISDGLTTILDVTACSALRFIGATGENRFLPGIVGLADTVVTELYAAWNQMSETAVDTILMGLDADGQWYGMVDLMGNSPPGIQGQIAKASLEVKGWQVYVES